MDQSLIFTKVLSKTDVEHRMAIPMESFAVFGIPQGKHSQDFDFLDMISTGRSWSFRCSIRTNNNFDFLDMINTGLSWSFRCSKRTNNSHPKPFLTSDWIKYVKEKCLKEGDRVSFFHVKKDGEERLQFGVQALKKSRLLGTDIWTAV